MTAPWCSILDQAGLTLRGWLPMSALVPWPDDVPAQARSVWLIGSPGGGLWQAFQQHLAQYPTWSQRKDPLDDYVDHVLAQARVAWEDAWGETRIYTPSRPILCEGRSQYLDFLALTQQAGWGSPGPLGMAIHPTWGPWFGLRAAVVTEWQPASYNEPLSSSVCQTCEAPCISACPAGAVLHERFDVNACAGFRMSGVDCQESCYARIVCPVGAAHRYEEAQFGFHMRHALAMFHRYRATLL